MFMRLASLQSIRHVADLSKWVHFHVVQMLNERLTENRVKAHGTNSGKISSLIYLINSISLSPLHSHFPCQNWGVSDTP